MIYLKISSCFSKIVCSFVLFFCCVGNLKGVNFSQVSGAYIGAEHFTEKVKHPMVSNLHIKTEQLTKKPEYYDDGCGDILIHAQITLEEVLEINNDIVLLDIVDEQKDTGCFHLQHDDEDNILITSNKKIKAIIKDHNFLISPKEQQRFNKNTIIFINNIGHSTNSGEFRWNQKVSTEKERPLATIENDTTTFPSCQLKRGITFYQKNGVVSCHPGIIPFEELEEPEENFEPDDDYYPMEQPTQTFEYHSTTEAQSEVESTYFSSLSDNKGTVACTAIGVAVTAIVAHVLSGRRYLSKADTWSNWEPNNLNSIGLRSLPEDLLLKQLYHEIAYRYGNCSDQIKAFLEEIEQEIHDLNLCYWSYSTLRGIYLLPKIQRFEEIEDRINLLTMLADTVRQDLANKSIKNLLS